MPRLYKTVTAALALTGSFSMIVSGELNPLFLMPGLAVFLGYYRCLTGKPSMPGWAVGGLSVFVLLMLLFDAVLVSGDFFIAIAHMTVAFQAIKSFDFKDPWDHLQVYFMSLLQLLIASELSSSIAIGAVFPVFLAVLIIAVVISHFANEKTLDVVNFKKPLIYMSLFVFIGTAVFFVVVPRVSGGVHFRKSSGRIKSVGFTETVNFGSYGDVLLDPTVVMRVELSGRRLPLYWRGLSLDYFDGISWKDTERKREAVYKTDGKFVIERVDALEPTVQKVYLEPMDTAVVFGLGKINRIEAPGKILYRDEAGALYLPGKSDRRFYYTAYGTDEERQIEESLYRYLQRPEGLEKVIELSGKITGGLEDDFKKADAVMSFLKEGFRYDLRATEPPADITPIEDFLFNTKSGFCEHFATSMALMLRASGVPARIVTGFAGGEENEYGDYIIVRQSNAHSWVEAAMDGRWVMYDPTPPARPRRATYFSLYADSLKMKWYRYVIGFDSYDQLEILRALSVPMPVMPDMAGMRIKVRPIYLVILIFGVSVAATVLIGRMDLKKRTYETKMYLKLKKAVIKKGGEINPSSTPLEVLQEAARVKINRKTAEGFIRLYEEARFGGRKYEKKDLESLLNELLK